MTGEASLAASSAGDVPLVELRAIRKSFGDLVANDGVDLTLRQGEVHALLGENGAGKTTLMRILYGLTRADRGEILIDGAPTTITSPRDAIRNGIGMVTQHFSLVKPMTVTENVMLSGAGLGPIDLGAARKKVLAAADRLGVTIDPDARVGRLSVGEQQRVEILKALYHDCRVLILDEPTAVLVPQDVQALFTTIRRITSQGLGVLFISHKLREVTSVSDRVSVLRRGRVIDTIDATGVEPRHLAELMVGRPTLGVERESAVASVAAARPVLDVAHLTVAGRGRNAVDDVTLQVHAGEIVGIAGVSGNGQRQLVDVLCGIERPADGRVRVDGRDVTGGGPQEMIAAGLGRIHEDRQGTLLTDLSVEQNLVFEHLAEFRRGPFLDRRRMRDYAENVIRRFDIKAQPTDTVASLSGGNVQKVLLARVLTREPKVVVVAQPTRGLDVGAAEYVHRQLLDLRKVGTGVLLVSEDLEELLALCDRLVVLFEGRVTGELAAADATPEGLGLLMTGAAA
ncbi:MAG TPA: ABC transporter ATP-binding protein [Jatrophihabitans sp.]|jgi:simple sugar transport system ATP-binding protein|nr:ABC transporter ATP-binding protein [Jatrophihabitans sp.]